MFEPFDIRELTCGCASIASACNILGRVSSRFSASWEVVLCNILFTLNYNEQDEFIQHAGGFRDCNGFIHFSADTCYYKNDDTAKILNDIDVQYRRGMQLCNRATPKS